MPRSLGGNREAFPLSSLVLPRSCVLHIPGMLSGGTWLPSLPAISGRIDRRGHPSAETRGHLQRPPAHFLPPGVPFRTKGTFRLRSLHPSLPFCKEVKDMEPVQLHPVISFSLLPSRPHGETG